MGTHQEAGAIIPVRDDYGAAKRPIISKSRGNWAFQMQGWGRWCPQYNLLPAADSPCVNDLSCLQLIPCWLQAPPYTWWWIAPGWAQSQSCTRTLISSSSSLYRVTSEATSVPLLQGQPGLATPHQDGTWLSGPN